ncbi:TSC22 domain family protein 1-like isoform X1 [Salvelinus fontinalis]|uniref:TSC22 domain family protein 1-like isoform X1 n=2 Tax=Salvelinus fontinalis TaxID=8038 RepID=UPI002486B2D8|nr:TSC22 domain family protein 1-like isoform X1 [Salvelinus fontinalis]
MHHPHSAGDSGSVRKMAHPANFPRRGNVSNINTGAGTVPTMSTPTISAVSKCHVPTEDYQSPLLMQSQPPVGSSSPGPQHPPHSLNLHSQPQPQALSSGSQMMMKKKSGFQITSVTPAQISVSTNNSIAEDTESYDDLDESHTEDLSSSEILDVSLSRANDMAGGARSSSEETLNNFHEADTPGAISPNQPPHSLPQGPQHGAARMVNGNVHHYHHQRQHNHPQQALAQPHSSDPHFTPTSGGAGGALKMPSTMEVHLENVSVGSASVATQPVAAVSLPGMHSSAAVASVSIANPLTSNVCNVNMYSSSNVSVMGGVSTSASSSGGGFPPSVMSCGGGVGGLMGSNFGNPNVNLIQHQSSGTVNSSISMTSAAPSGSVVLGPSSGTQGGGAAIPQPGMSSSGMALASVPSSQPPPTPAPATTSSRFRVVKLDSSSEPFKKGRWTCAEYYDKETPALAPAPLSSEATAPSGRVVESMQPCGPESVKGGSERESTGGGSVSSTVSTLSHYTESVGSGDAGGPPLLQPHPHYQDYSNPPPSFQTSRPGFPMVVSHPQSHLLTTVAPSVPASVHQPAPINMAGLQTTIGHPTTPIHQQPLTYAQAASNPAPGSAQSLVGVLQKQMGYALTQQPSATPQVAPVHRLSQGGGMPPDYPQPKAGLAQPAVPQALPGSGQMMGVSQQKVVGSIPQLQPQGLIQQQPQQTSIQASAVGGGLMPQMGPGGVTGFGQQPQGHSLPLDHQHHQQQQSFPSKAQGLATQLSNTAPPNQGCLVSNVLPPNPQSDPQNGSGLAQSHPQAQPPGVSMPQDFNSAQAHTQAVASQASALYASLPSFTTTQLEDAQRLLFQDQSALLAQTMAKLAGEGGTAAGTSLGAESNAAAATAVSALTSSAGLFKAVEGDDDGSSGASVVAIDNKIEQAMDLVKSHLMYAVREEVEVLKEQIKELIERNSQLEQENSLLKTLASPEQMAQFQAQTQTGSPPTSTQPPAQAPTLPPAQPSHNSGPSA